MGRRRKRSAGTRPPARGGIDPVGFASSGEGSLGQQLQAQLERKLSLSAGEIANFVAKAFAAGDVVSPLGIALSPDNKLLAGQRYYLHRAAPDEGAALPKLQVLWEGEGAIVVNKPASLATIPRGSWITRSVVVAARRQFHNDQISAAHRLDRLTTGCLLLTLDSKYRARYQQLFDRRQVKKTYLARSRGDGDRGEAAAPQVGESFDFQLEMYKETGSLTVSIGAPPAGRKVTRCQSRTRGLVLGKFPLPEKTEKSEGEGNANPGSQGTAPEEELLWQLEPETGFTHQLRATLAHFGYPLLGDPLYPEVLPADAPENIDPQLCLHAHQLQFPDPENSGTTVTVTAPTPTWAKGALS
ncbi:pseudouridine synthase [uncultured Varibaculum sp.]|uniref:pseudouridine synthase n=1 Tax=uncultured Varibaculum sp. TaxID=413896 RepID=UPI002599AA15|nr:pseudouridine synthase [uncultured Varibaculum sp.]